MSRIRNYACRTINKFAKHPAHPAKRRVFSGRQPQTNSLGLVRYSGVVLLACLEPLQANLLWAHLEPLGHSDPPRAFFLEALRSESLNLLLAPVLAPPVVQVHSGDQNMLQNSEASSVSQVGAWSQLPYFLSNLLHSKAHGRSW
jgi:hypothetical protein